MEAQPTCINLHLHMSMGARDLQTVSLIAVPGVANCINLRLHMAMGARDLQTVSLLIVPGGSNLCLGHLAYTISPTPSHRHMSMGARASKQRAPYIYNSQRQSLPLSPARWTTDTCAFAVNSS
jgi:hypothetical protein